MSLNKLLRTWQTNKRRALNLHAGLARRKLQPVREKFYRDLWAASAQEIDATIESFAGGLVRISKDGLATFVSESDLMLDSALTLRVFADKSLHYQMMASKALRMPEFLRFTLNTINEAETFRSSQNGPVVVKPADGTGGGRGVITGIDSHAKLVAASRHAAGFNQKLLVEEQLTGACFRLLFLNGQFLDAVRRDSPYVSGDGQSSIAKLVKRENAARVNLAKITALSPLIIDRESRNTLAADGRTISSIPQSGQNVRVKLAVNENGSAQNHIVRADVHPEIIKTGEHLVRDFGIKFAGLDITSDDISAPLLEGDTRFNEINVNPGIHHHYLVANPEQSAAVAPMLLERMFEQRIGTIKI